MRVLISGAGGKTGQAVTAALQARGFEPRPFLRHSPHDPPTADWVAGDMTDPADWARATAGIDVVYHICPNMHPDEVALGTLAIAAAAQAGVRHFVYHSVLHPQTQTMPHHWHKLRVEERLLESRLPFTILQPTAYVQNIRAGWRTICDAGEYAVPYPAATRISLVDLADVADVAARVAGDAAHFGATYELVGTRPLSQTEVAQTLTAVVGRAVHVREIPLDAWRAGAEATGLATYAIETLLSMFRYYADYGLVGNPTVLRLLLGREPGSPAACFQRWQQAPHMI